MKRVIESSTNSGILAVFWYVDGKFVGKEDIFDGDSVCQYGDYIQVDLDHFNIWPAYSPSKHIEYDYYPRGRVMFNAKIHKFVVVADPKIVNSRDIRDKLLDFYGLPNTTIFESDEHYQSEAEV